MWILVVVQQFYPSVYHFETEEEAKQAFDSYEAFEAIKHLAKVEETEEVGIRFNKNNIKSWDVEWL